jgi:hypothetical protein
MNTRHFYVLTPLTALLLAGCGGGGGMSSGGATSSAPSSPPPAAASTVTVGTAKDQTIEQDSSSDVVPFSVADSGGSSSNVAVTAQSSNPALFDPQGLVLGGNAGDRTLILYPKAGASGTATITLTGTGSNSSTGSSKFIVNVTSQQRTTSSMVDAVAAQSSDAAPMSTTGYQWTDDAANNPSAFDNLIAQ